MTNHSYLDFLPCLYLFTIEVVGKGVLKMKKFLFIFLVIVALTSFSEAKRKTKKYLKDHKYNSDVLQEQIVEAEPVEVRFEQLKQTESEQERDVLEAMDPCDGKCGSGQVCELADGVAMCVCITSCPEEKDPRRKVCSNLNTTWGSDCELHQMRCWCRSAHENCVVDREKQSHMHIDYYGDCHEPKECKQEEMVDFPRRMRDWLFNVMRDTADRDELSTYYMQMEREAETNLSKRWINAAIWKFCELDKSNDRTISRHEIFPIRAPLVALEHCIAPFLDKCDGDGNHRITLKEWASCLEINEDEIEDRCEDVRDTNEE